MSGKGKRSNNSDETVSNKRRKTTQNSVAALNDITNIASIPPNQQNTSRFFRDESVSSNSLNLSPVDERKERLNELLEKANNDIFLQKKLYFGEIEKLYSPVYNFFDFKTIYDIKPGNKVKFTCIICMKQLNEKIGKISNLCKHLESTECKKLDETYQLWKKLYDQSKAIQVEVNF